MNKVSVALALAGLTSLSAATHAEVQFSGFGSLTGGISTDSDAEVRGYGDDVDFSTGSFFALQAYADLSEGLSATAQIRARGSKNWEPEFTWAYLSYEVQDNWRVQVGRQRIPIYLYSDYLDVSYAYHWIAPPSEVYQAPFDSLDGIGTIHDFNLGDASVNLRLYYGREETHEDGSHQQMENIVSAVASVNYGWWTFRSSYLQFDFTYDVDFNGLTDYWRTTPFASVADDLEIQDDQLQGVEVGVIYDNLDWLFVAEYTPSKTDHSLLGDLKPWMVSLGKRFGNVMVHGTYGHNTRSPYDALSGVPFGVDPTLDQLYVATEGLLKSRDVDLPFYTLGARWDFHPSAALKVEYTNSEQTDGSNAGVIQTALVTVF